MHFITPTEKDKIYWDALVLKHHGSVFSESCYLDSTAENWMIVYNTDRSAGMVCPYTLKLGVKILYAPFFHRFMEWIGEQMDWNSILDVLKREFTVADAHINAIIPKMKARYFQIIEPNELNLNQQAKRSLKKAIDFQVVEKLNRGELIQLIENELGSKIAAINSETALLLEKLTQSFEPSRIIQLNLMEKEHWKGGIWLIENSTTVLYLKGTVEPASKQIGGMYTLIHHGINYASSKNKRFDFGGSSNENVRRFNLHFGAKDAVYSHLQWNNAPFWWNVLRKTKHAWSKK